MPQLTVRTAVTDILRSGSATRGAVGAAAYRAGCAAVLSLIAGTALAQQAAPAQTASTAGVGTLEEVVVTGFRRSIENAIEVKKDAGSIVEAISAEDIGKLPDTSIAESLSRLPGLTSQRANGRSSSISLRGTDPAFTNALLNGREQVSTGDNRSVEFDQYPSELLSAVVVYKTPDAQLVGQGLAGTIDLRTQRPLEYGKRALQFNVRGERNSQNDLGGDSTDAGWRASVSYIDQFFDNTVGVTLGYAHLNSPMAQQGFGAYEPWHPNCTTGPNCDGYNFHADVPTGLFVTNGAKVRTDMGKNVRDGALATFEWKPTDSFTSTLDAYYTKSKETDEARSLEWNLGNYPATTSYSNLIIRDQTVTGATVGNVRPLVRNFEFLTDDKILSTGWNNRLTAGEWTFVGDLSYSKATRDQFQPETNAQWGNCPGGGDAACTDTGQFALYGGQNMPNASFAKNYADPSQIFFGPTIYGAGYVKAPKVKDELKSARIDITRTVGGWFDDATFSVNYSDRQKDKSSAENNLFLKSGTPVNIDAKYLLSPTNLSYAGAGNALAWSVPGVLAAYYQPITYLTPNAAPYLVGKDWTVTEKVTTASLRANLNHDLTSAITLRGNIGLQFIRTKQGSSSYRIVPATGGTAVQAFSQEKTYDDVLPQFNFAFVLPDDQTVRLGLAREMARPRMDQLKASTEFGVSQTTGLPGASGGNPLLNPWRANAVDLSYEKYFAENKAYFQAAAFYKKLVSYIYNATDQNHNFSGLIAGLPAGYLPPGITAQNTGPFNQPLNGAGGNLKGVELSATLQGDLFTDVLKGWGVIFSISQTDSNITIQDPPSGNNSQITTTGFGTIPLPGLSKTVWNATLFFERDGFSARVGTRSRSKYIGEITNYSNDRAFRFVKGEQITDAQVQYDFSGRLNGMSLQFQVNNLTNAPYVAYANTESRLIDYQTYGRQFLFGVNYKLQ